MGAPACCNRALFLRTMVMKGRPSRTVACNPENGYPTSTVWDRNGVTHIQMHRPSGIEGAGTTTMSAAVFPCLVCFAYVCHSCILVALS